MWLTFVEGGLGNDPVWMMEAVCASLTTAQNNSGEPEVCFVTEGMIFFFMLDQLPLKIVMCGQAHL